MITHGHTRRAISFMIVVQKTQVQAKHSGPTEIQA